MKKIFLILSLAVSLVLMNSCSLSRIIPWQMNVIPGHYEYTHSWTYPSPEGGYTITCYEEGTIDFERYGRYTDRAVQYHTANTPDQTCWTFDYLCTGRWDVQDDQFLMSQSALDFEMELMGVNIDYYHGDLEWAVGMADLLRQNSTPRSSRYITYQIAVLDDHHFTWSYTYPNGHTDYWEMHRVQ